ncbi:hypothetical protein E2320_011420 [Naja naja]|nr:hypothetical protein E2320_011420 [Naja naja]
MDDMPTFVVVIESSQLNTTRRDSTFEFKSGGSFQAAQGCYLPIALVPLRTMGAQTTGETTVRLKSSWPLSAARLARVIEVSYRASMPHGNQSVTGYNWGRVVIKKPIGYPHSDPTASTSGAGQLIDETQSDYLFIWKFGFPCL